MDFRQLTTFTAIVRTGSFSAAARELGYAQSTITSHIQALEDHLGTPLFDRLTRQVQLTHAGNILYRHAQTLLQLAAQAEQEIMHPSAPSGTLRIGTPESLCAELLPSLIKEYSHLYPAVDVQLRFDTCQNFRTALRKSTLDAALFLDEPLQEPALAVHALFLEPMALLVSPDHPLAHAATVSPQDLNGQALLLTEPGCSYRLLFENMLRQHQITPRSILEISSIEVIRQFAVHGLGITFLSRRAAAQELKDGRLQALAWQGPDFPIWAQLAYHRDKWRSPALTAFIALCRTRLGPA